MGIRGKTCWERTAEQGDLDSKRAREINKED